jgi:hypothetical protein
MTSVILVLGASSWAPAVLPIIGIVIGAVAAIVGGAFAAVALNLSYHFVFCHALTSTKSAEESTGIVAQSFLTKSSLMP